MREESCKFLGGPKDGGLEKSVPKAEMRFHLDVVLKSRVSNGKPDGYDRLRLEHRYNFEARTEEGVWIYRYVGVKES